MNRRIGLLLLLLAPIGCYAPLTTRLDSTNQQMMGMRADLAQANSHLAKMEGHVAKMEEQITQANKRLQPLERLMKPFGGGETSVPAPAPMPPVVPISTEQCWEGKVKPAR
jgi:hypothetical protein